MFGLIVAFLTGLALGILGMFVLGYYLMDP